MSNKKKEVISDLQVIDINESVELRLWADKLDVTAARLKAAVNVVGNSAKKVEAYLKLATKPNPSKDRLR